MANTTTEAEIKALIAKGLSWTEMGKELGIPAPSLRAAGSVLGLRSGTRRDTLAFGKEWAERVDACETIAEICEAEGVSRHAVSRAIKAYRERGHG